MEIVVDQERRRAFERSIQAMAEFRAAFGRDLEPGFVAELYAATKLGLRLVGVNQSGYDALGPGGERYQVKFRSPGTLNVDINDFDFDYLVLVNMDEGYQLIGMWRITVDQAKSIFVERATFRKHQATQSQIKNIGERVGDNAVEARRLGEPSLASSGTPGRRWRELRGAAEYPLVGEDAQEWVSRSRREEEDQSGAAR